LSNDPCGICGALCDPDGLDYTLKGINSLVCDFCAKKYAPELVDAKNEALRYLQWTCSQCSRITERARKELKEEIAF
jgi:hypothetical protein